MKKIKRILLYNKSFKNAGQKAALLGRRKRRSDRLILTLCAMNEDQVLAVLKDCEFFEGAERRYDVMRGGFVWSDEMPSRGSGLKENIMAIHVLARVIAYRASLTTGSPNEECRVEWEELRRILPNWPGFREERIYGQVKRDLKAVKLKEEKCLKDLGGEF